MKCKHGTCKFSSVKYIDKVLINNVCPPLKIDTHYFVSSKRHLNQVYRKKHTATCIFKENHAITALGMALKCPEDVVT